MSLPCVRYTVSCRVINRGMTMAVKNNTAVAPYPSSNRLIHLTNYVIKQSPDGVTDIVCIVGTHHQHKWDF